MSISDRAAQLVAARTPFVRATVVRAQQPTSARPGDEAILLADRVVMMTNGPHARIGNIMDVDLPRPRTRKALLEHPKYYEYREELLTFLADCDRQHRAA